MSAAACIIRVCRLLAYNAVAWRQGRHSMLVKPGKLGEDATRTKSTIIIRQAVLAPNRTVGRSCGLFM